MTALVYEANGISKNYTFDGGTITAVDNANFRIAEGEFVTITGPSGSGKSTLLSLLGLLSMPSGGELRFCGREVTTLKHHQTAQLRNQSIGFVFQSFQLLPRTTSLNNVALPLVYAGVPPKERALRAEEALQRVGMADRKHHKPNQLSGGEQQRVAIARALVNRPRVILADEPTGALDTRTGNDVLALLRELNDQGTAVVLITHNLGVASSAAHQMELVDGRLGSSVPHTSAP